MSSTQLLASISSADIATAGTATVAVLTKKLASNSLTFIIAASGPPQAPAPIAITTSSVLPNATVNAAYSVSLTATGGTPPYTWSLVSGQLPAGLALSITGVIAGTPTASGNFSFSLQVTDSASSPQAALQTETLAVAASTSTDTRPRDSYGWVVCDTSGGFAPLSDNQTAALITPAAENRSGNTTANQYKPSSSEISTYLNSETNSYGQLPAQFNPYYAFVTGGYTGTTDEIIQWAAIKWGIPPDWLRAQYVQESYWNMSQLGDLTTVANPLAYPALSRASGSQVYQSLGIAQVKWNHPDLNDSGIGTEPLRWESTAFNADYQAATVRFYFDNPQGMRSVWGDSTYSPCNNWLSIGGWFEPYPWNNSGQQNYVSLVQTQLATKAWTQPTF